MLLPSIIVIWTSVYDGLERKEPQFRNIGWEGPVGRYRSVWVGLRYTLWERVPPGCLNTISKLTMVRLQGEVLDERGELIRVLDVVL